MAFNPMMLMKIKGLFDRFQKNHPKVPMFFQAAAKAIDEGSVIEITVTTSDGKNLCTNMRVNADDVALVNDIKDLVQKQ